MTIEKGWGIFDALTCDHPMLADIEHWMTPPYPKCMAEEINGREKPMAELEDSPISKYGAATVRCVLCGRCHTMAYPIPVKMPCECPYCGGMTCYFIVDKEEQ